MFENQWSQVYEPNYYCYNQACGIQNQKCLQGQCYSCSLRNRNFLDNDIESFDNIESMPSMYPTILQPLLEIEGSTNPQYFQNPQLVLNPEIWPRGDKLKFKLPPNSYITQIIMKLEGNYKHQIELTIKNKDSNVYHNNYEFTTDGSLECNEYSGPATEFSIINQKPENPLICSVFILIGTFIDFCSRHITENQIFLQPLFICETCKMKPNEYICKACAENCHAGHKLRMVNCPGLCHCLDYNCKIRNIKNSTVSIASPSHKKHSRNYKHKKQIT